MKRVKSVLKLLGWFLWFTVALLMVTIGAGAAMGAITGNWLNGVVVMFGGGMLIVFGEVGKTMITRMSVLVQDLQRAFKKASDHIEDQMDERKK